MNIQKSILPATNNCTTSKQMENKSLRLTFTVNTKTTKYLEINLTTYVQVCYTKNYKILLREFKEYLNKWKYMPYVHGWKT